MSTKPAKNFIKKILPYVLMVLIVASVTGGVVCVPSVVNAQEVFDPAYGQEYNPNTQQVERGKVETPSTLGFFDVVTAIANLPITVIKWVASAILHLMGGLLGLVGIILNLVVQKLVVGMAVTIRGIAGIDVAWKVFRDLANMLFIFILLYIAIATILRVEGYQAKNLLKNVIIVALLVNFSLFFTKVIVDASNIVTLGFYNAVAPGAAQGNVVMTGLANTFMEPIRLQTIGSVNLLGSIGDQWGDMPRFVIGAIGSALVIVVTMFVFITIAVLLVTRFVILIFVMILSPVGFAASVLPGTRQYAKKWWNALLEQALFAPALMALLWVSAMILNGVSGNAAGSVTGQFSGGKSFGDLFLNSLGAADQTALVNQGGQATAFNTFLNFFITIAFLLASVIIAQMLGGPGAGAMMKFGNTARQ